MTVKEFIKKYEELQEENKQLKKDIKFCLISIKQEMKVSTDSRTRKEMKTCYTILKKHVLENKKDYLLEILDRNVK